MSESKQLIQKIKEEINGVLRSAVNDSNKYTCQENLVLKKYNNGGDSQLELVRHRGSGTETLILTSNNDRDYLFHISCENSEIKEIRSLRSKPKWRLVREDDGGKLILYLNFGDTDHRYIVTHNNSVIEKIEPYDDKQNKEDKGRAKKVQKYAKKSRWQTFDAQCVDRPDLGLDTNTQQILIDNIEKLRSKLDAMILDEDVRYEVLKLVLEKGGFKITENKVSINQSMKNGRWDSGKWEEMNDTEKMKLNAAKNKRGLWWLFICDNDIRYAFAAQDVYGGKYEECEGLRQFQERMSDIKAWRCIEAIPEVMSEGSSGCSLDLYRRVVKSHKQALMANTEIKSMPDGYGRILNDEGDEANGRLLWEVYALREAAIEILNEMSGFFNFWKRWWTQRKLYERAQQALLNSYRKAGQQHEDSPRTRLSVPARAQSEDHIYVKRFSDLFQPRRQVRPAAPANLPGYQALRRPA